MIGRLPRPLVLFVLALLIFGTSASIFPAVERAGWFPAAPPWTSQAVTKSVMLIASLLLIATDRRRSFAEYGFRSPVSPRWFRQILLGGATGAAATALIVVTPANGMGATLAGFGLLDLVLWIWLYSSVSEEVFTRGWYQTAISSGAVDQSATSTVAWSGILFGTLHLSLLVTATDLWTVAIIVCAATVLGLVAAAARQRSGSLWPALVAHVAFNVFGTFTGIVFTIVSMVSNRAQ